MVNKIVNISNVGNIPVSLRTDKANCSFGFTSVGFISSPSSRRVTVLAWQIVIIYLGEYFSLITFRIYTQWQVLKI